MKTASDPRHQNRVKVMQELFAFDFSDENNIDPQTKEIIKNKSKIDKLIAKAAPAWPIEKINRIDIAVLRQAAYELTFKKDVPVKVVVDEAVELGKEFGGESSPSFINGVLGKLIIDNKIKI